MPQSLAQVYLHVVFSTKDRYPFLQEQGIRDKASVSPGHVELSRNYIADQEEHHRRETFQEEFRRLLTKHSLEWHERYGWD